MNTTTTYKNPLEHKYLHSEIRDRHHKSILKHLLNKFAIRPGDTVLEIGAGSGRYTKLLIDEGLKVIAIEPDAILASKLWNRFGSSNHLQVEIATAADIECLGLDERVNLVCGFHVLHHLNDKTLANLGTYLLKQVSSSEEFRGWFFWEPNPFNPLYPVQIFTTPAMSFVEERGMWRMNYRKLLGFSEEESILLGTVGLFPPRSLTYHLPQWMQDIGTIIKPGLKIMRLYQIIGRVIE